MTFGNVVDTMLLADCMTCKVGEPSLHRHVKRHDSPRWSVKVDLLALRHVVEQTFVERRELCFMEGSGSLVCEICDRHVEVICAVICRVRCWESQDLASQR